MTPRQFAARLALAVALTPVLRVIDYWADGPIRGGLAWLIAALAALCLVFLGEWLWDRFVEDLHG